MNTALEEAKRHFQLGLNLIGLKDFAGAEEKFKMALSFAPDRISILINLSAALVQLGKWSECEKICLKVLSLEPQNYDALLNLSACLSHCNREMEALECLDKAIAINPNLDLAWTNKANIYQEIGQLNQAASCFEKAISINPQSQEALIGRGNLHNEYKEYQLALQDFDAALKINPSNPQAKWNKALSLLRLGNFAEGWKLYESRWEIPGMREYQKHLNIPLWLGQESLKDKTILIHAEQGYGDTIQFSRYLPQLENMGARVLFEVPRPLVTLMKTLSRTINVIESGSKNIRATHPKIDFQCPVMSLALAFKTQPQTIPQGIPYLSTDKTKLATWKDRLQEITSTNSRLENPLRIGINWSGSGHYAGKKNYKRDIPLLELSKKLASYMFKGVEIHSLQNNPCESDLQTLAEFKIYSHHKLIREFLDTACLIKQLDLIISVDTATAHLAGALGKRVWILLPTPSDFMVLLNQHAHPWYKNCTSLIQQINPKDWNAPLEEISNRLQIWLEGIHRHGI